MSAKPAAVLFALRAVNQSKATIDQLKGQFRGLRVQAALTARSLRMQNVAAAFTRLKTSMKGISAASGMMGNALRGALAPLTALMGGGAAVGLWRMVSATTAAGDSLAKMSQRTGIAVEALQELKFGAAREGVDGATFDTAMKDFNKNIGEARNGVGEALPLFKKLGIDLNDSAGNARTNKDIMDDLADAMARIKDPASKAALANKVMGESGAKMTLLLSKGREGIAAYGVEARNLGIITESQAKAAEEMANKTENMGRAWDGLSASITEKLLPVLGPVIVQITNWIAANRDLIATKVGAFIKDLVKWFDQLDLNKVLGVFQSLISSVVAVKDWFGSWGKMIAWIVVLLHAGLIFAVLKAVVALGQLGVALLVTTARMAAMGAMAVAKMVFDFFVAMKYGVGIMKALNIAMASNPIGLLVVALAAAAGLVMAYWEPIKEWFSGFDFLSPIKKQVTALAGVLPDWVSAKLGLSVAKTTVADANAYSAFGLGGLSASGGANMAPSIAMTRPPVPVAAKSEVTVTLKADNLPAGMRVDAERPRGDANTRVNTQRIGPGHFSRPAYAG